MRNFQEWDLCNEFILTIHQYYHDHLQLNELVCTIGNCFESAINKTAPLTKRRNCKLISEPWENDREVVSAKRKKEISYKIWRRDRPDKEKRLTFITSVSKFKSCLTLAKSRYFTELSKSRNTRQLWAQINKFVKAKDSLTDSSRLSADELNRNYVSIGATTTVTIEEVFAFIESTDSNTNAFNLVPVTPEHVENIIHNFKPYKYGCEGWNSIFMKSAKKVLAPYICKIINLSFEMAEFPNQWKCGKITPVPKLPKPKSPNDYRPITVLPLMSKPIEKVVAKQLNAWLENDRILYRTQSGFRRGFSTETILMYVKQKIQEHINTSHMCFLVILDFSKAFDCVAHDILIRKLHSYGMGKRSLRWFASYLGNRTVCTKFDDEISDPLPISSGVPQGSVLGPILFNIYAADMASFISNGLVFQYADDTQILLSVAKDNLDEQTVNNMISRCLEEAKGWSTKNYIKLNETKTKVLPISTHNNMSTRLPSFSSGIECYITYTAKNLGIIFDSSLKWTDHIDSLILNVNKKAHILRRFFREFISPQNRQLRFMIVNALIISSITYCCSLFKPLKKQNLKRIHRLIKTAASLILNRYCHTEDLKDARLLSADDNINLAIAKMTHRSIHNIEFAPYIECELQTTERHRRQNQQHLLKGQTNEFRNTFKDIAANIFNSLPLEIRATKNFTKFSKLCHNHFISHL